MNNGVWAEDLALQHLCAQGLKPVTRNYRCKRGEIDLILRDGEMQVFVEVRLRNHAAYGSGAESVSAGKRRRIAATASHYLQAHHGSDEPPCRFDVVSVSGSPDTHKLDWIKDAFQA